MAALPVGGYDRCMTTIYLPAKCDDLTLNGLKHGIIASQTDRGRYRPNADCKVFFNVGPNQIVHFEFEDFSLQNRIRGKCVDFVQFFADDGLRSPLTEPLCGQSLPGTMSSNASRIVLYFHSNSKHETKGFKMRFKRSELASDHFRSTCSSRSLAANRKHFSYFLRLPAIFLLFPAMLVSLVLYRQLS
ncbi:hypothetical protein LSH36_824g01041 [Paralvinella palmiformis]|uniref:CUB domain-containing protein n=1 Tax=Paralvinella palmiformis TaxID=53620 RepID=A0AAD9IZK7_9ANNE|nr:hypothetical protein LSH36_824g01041 [Paralvinella palmiformis]